MIRWNISFNLGSTISFFADSKNDASFSLDW
jgi:hypothetical protein